MNYYVILVLPCMIFCHILDDYYHQGILANMKQKKWWEENAPDKIYKHDYIVALIMHAFSWAFTISIPPIVFLILVGCTDISGILLMFIINFLVHAIVDHMKANLLWINLIEDQSIHILQIVVTWILFLQVLRYNI